LLIPKEAKYFGLVNINQDQLEDYASRMNISVDNAQKWLSPNLN
jgi:5-methyltetrahydrofolate--homocysteine methyltransferase